MMAWFSRFIFFNRRCVFVLFNVQRFLWMRNGLIKFIAKHINGFIIYTSVWTRKILGSSSSQKYSIKLLTIRSNLIQMKDQISDNFSEFCVWISSTIKKKPCKFCTQTLPFSSHESPFFFDLASSGVQYDTMNERHDTKSTKPYAHTRRFRMWETIQTIK